MKRRSRVPDWLALAACALLAVLALYNPIFHLPDHVPTDIVPVVTDYFHYHWNYWWIRHALSTGLNVYLTNYVFTPFTSSLALHPLTPLFYPIWALFEPLTGTITAMVVVYLVAYTLTGYSVYLLLRDEKVAPGWALVGAAMVEVCTLMTTSARWTMISLMGWFWLPILLLTWKRISFAMGRRLWMWALALGAVIWGMILTDLQYPLFAAPLIIPYGVWTLWRADGTKARLRLIAAGIFALVVGAILSSVLGPLDEALTFDRTGLSPTPVERAVSIAFPTCYITTCDQGVSVGSVWLLLLGAALPIWWMARRRARHKPAASAQTAPPWLWLIMIPVPLLLSAGPSIQIGGSVISMPYALMHQIFGGLVRYPERFLPSFLIPALVFGLGAISRAAKNRPAIRWLIPPLLLLVVADTRVLRPIPVKSIPPPHVTYSMIAAEPYDEAVVEIPTGGASGEGIVGDARYAELEFYGMTHGKRMVNGHISRVNTYHYFYMNTDDPMMAWLGQRRFLEPTAVEQEMRERIPDWRIGYFIIHRDLITPDQSAIDEIVSFFNAHNDLVCPVGTDGDLVVYRTRWNPAGCPPVQPKSIALDTYQIDIGGSDDVLYLGEGWYYPEAIFDTTIRWAGAEPTASLYADLPPGVYRLTLHAQAYLETRTVSLLVNGIPVSNPQQISPDALADYDFDIPSESIGGGQHLRFSLSFDAHLSSTDAVDQGGDARTLAIMVDSVTLTLKEKT